MTAFADTGFARCAHDPRVARWAQAAHRAGLRVAMDPVQRQRWLRHQGTWFVGVDSLPNSGDGSMDGAALCGGWDNYVTAPDHWHAAQLSVVYPGYPGQDAGESDANHRFRVTRHAAHIDGILLEQGRRYLREPHRFVLGLPLNDSAACPLMVWPGSHRMIGPALRARIGAAEPGDVDITEAYKAVRAEVFARIAPVPLRVRPGEALVLHRHLLHGIAPWAEGDRAPPEGRMVAYFRPQFERLRDWL